MLHFFYLLPYIHDMMDMSHCGSDLIVYACTCTCRGSEPVVGGAMYMIHVSKDVRIVTDYVCICLCSYVASRKALEGQIQKFKSEKNSVHTKLLLLEERYGSLENELEEVQEKNHDLAEAKADLEVSIPIHYNYKCMCIYMYVHVCLVMM